jgi:hypothetical protein
MIGNAAILEDAISKFINLEEAFNEFVSRLMQEPDFADWLIYFNRVQMQEGKRPDNSDIEKSPKGHQTSNKYEPLTKWLKDKKGRKWDRVTLLDEGDFYSSEKIKIAGEQIEFFATDPKTPDLIRTWGDVLGISDENLEKFIEIIRPEFISFAYNYFV